MSDWRPMPAMPHPFAWTADLARAIELVEEERQRRGGHARCTFDFAVQRIMRRAENMLIRAHLRGQPAPLSRARKTAGLQVGRS